MGKHFSDEQIEEFLKAYLARFPDAVERMECVMLNPFEDNDGLMSRNFREIYQVAQSMEFFTAYAKNEPSAIHHLVRDVARRVSAGLGPIESRKIKY
ncbi:MAG: hypothetical protein EOS54_29650 [Mesorhizobium sp.]|uniref:hypothetical protein n=1 Tax=unclassified Mesorhizobium TaxID=325217 RepID=UPI000F765ADB|nr:MULTISPECIES: hypothetical protein [unclassified Mesorhizobium]AZO46754.1 hypothetical protein EJ073_02230 [Mesorhizobium sp. M4B.F.Ca.ET.058.02.1.1]RUX48656.1 hypothetical protein EOA33_14925 [Mesorhizobium sp. M4A.F.Ca.ET.050.02.1.1]RVC43210.1 hypothetical protein EN781_19125 [Mesorhizobium sp. M4A.F.Ca.ET.090.04.2.1]RVD40989.1 hypothetical protein EN742_11280 [Mesorhizobium sp. M4A.F.Ca.ET.020.02.1.1]RWC20057.1 MAG: hypothetical protein EOS53_11090 [Mesorhizobium sp.]